MLIGRITIGLACALLVGCASQVNGGLDDKVDDRIHVAAAEIGDTKGEVLQALCDQEVRAEHWIDVGDGVWIHVIERYSGRALARSPRRAILMLPATLATNQWFDADIPGDRSYNALHQAASRGFFGFAMSYEGFGKSSIPADGAVITAQRCLEQAGEVLEWIRKYRGVPKVDVLGNSVGASIAMALGGTESPINRNHVNRVVISTSVYKQVSPALQAAYTPAYRAFLLGLPGHYITTTPASYALVFSGMAPEARVWADATTPGVYPIGPILEVFALPFFEAAPGRAPLLQFWGSDSPTTPFMDVQQLEREYGGPYRLVVLDGAAHSPTFEPVRHQFWDQTESFLNEGSPTGASPCDKIASIP